MTIPGGQAQNTTHVVCCNFLATPSVLGAPASLIRSEFPQSTWLRPFDLPRPDTARLPLHETSQNGGALLDPDLPDDVRVFMESVLKSFPDLDIYLLAMTRRREPTEEVHEALTKVMRDLL